MIWIADGIFYVVFSIAHNLLRLCNSDDLKTLKYSMNNAPRDTLRRIIAKYGKDLCSDARRCEGLLKDLCGEYRREINVLTSALEERVPLDLLASGKTMPRELLLTKLAGRLEDNLGLTKEASHWAVDSWALALGVVTDSEIEEKEKRQSKITTPTLPKTTDSKVEQNNQTSARNNPFQSPQRPTQTQPKPQQPKIYPPILRSPANAPAPLPKSSPQTSGSNINVPKNPAQASDPAFNSIPKKRFGKFFGCLVVLVLLFLTGIILLFGVPYAIDVMRETQQSEPPRFPPR